MAPADIKQDLAAEAVKIVTGARRSAYGKPEHNFERIASLWNPYFRSIHGNHGEGRQPTFITPRDVALLMVLMKVARLAETPNHRDSIVDILGYTLCYGEMVLPSEQAESETVLDRLMSNAEGKTAEELIAQETGTGWQAVRP